MSIRITSNGLPASRAARAASTAQLPVLDGRHLGPGLLQQEADQPLVVRPVLGQEDPAVQFDLVWRLPAAADRRAIASRPPGPLRTMRMPSSGPGSIVTLKVLPLPGAERTSMSPPRASARRLLMQRPSPVPPNFRVDEVSTWLNGLEELPDLLFVHADARVGHVEAEARATTVSDEADGDADFAVVGELDRVAHQVDQHLAEAQGIGEDGLGQGTGEFRLQRQVASRRPARASARRPRPPVGPASSGLARSAACRLRSSRGRGCR